MRSNPDVCIADSELLAPLCPGPVIHIPAYTGTPIAETSLAMRVASDEANWEAMLAAGWKPGMRWRNFGKWITEDDTGPPDDGMWIMGWEVDDLALYSTTRKGPGFIQAYPTVGKSLHGANVQADDGTNSVIVIGDHYTMVVDPTYRLASGRPICAQLTQHDLRKVCARLGGRIIAPREIAMLHSWPRANAPIVTRRTIRRGDTGADVAAWQAAIGVASDGAFGANTERATKEWQKAKGLYPDGIVGEKSWRAIGEQWAPRKSSGLARYPGNAPACTAMLRDANSAWPKRNRASDGIAGDAAHRLRPSAHNLGNAADVTHDKLNGCDGALLVEMAMRDPRTLLTIFNGLIRNVTIGNGAPRKYTGSNPHKSHAHIEVKPSMREDASKWEWSK